MVPTIVEPAEAKFKLDRRGQIDDHHDNKHDPEHGQAQTDLRVSGGASLNAGRESFGVSARHGTGYLQAFFGSGLGCDSSGSTDCSRASASGSAFSDGAVSGFVSLLGCLSTDLLAIVACSYAVRAA